MLRWVPLDEAIDAVLAGRCRTRILVIAVLRSAVPDEAETRSSGSSIGTCGTSRSSADFGQHGRGVSRDLARSLGASAATPDARRSSSPGALAADVAGPAQATEPLTASSIARMLSSVRGFIASCSTKG